MNKLTAKSDNQLEYIRCIKNNVITLVKGPSGTGKTSIAVAAGADLLRKGAVGKLLLTRPLIQCEEELGFLKGGLEDKVNPFMTPLLVELEKWTTPQEFKAWTTANLIEIAPLALMRGRNLHNYYVVCDEAQNCSFIQLKMLLTRTGENTKIIIAGDDDQLDVDDSGFVDVYNSLKNIEGIGLCRLDHNDIQRSSIISRILQALK